MEDQTTAESIIARTRCWIGRVVVELNLCPFARKPYEGEKVRYVVSTARQTDDLLRDLQRELEHLHATAPDEIETTVLIHPAVLNEFLDYNDFLSDVDSALKAWGYEGEFQVASFHPHYQFAGTHPDDAENYTNRSPYPMLHLLREASLTQAIDSYARPDKIPERNIRTLEKLGTEQMQGMLDACLHQGGHK